MLQQLPLLLSKFLCGLQGPSMTPVPPLLSGLPSTLTPAPTSGSGTQQAGLYSLLNLLTEL